MRTLFSKKFNNRFSGLSGLSCLSGRRAKKSAKDSADELKKNSRGFILVYTVMIMTFVVTLIGAAVSMLQSTSSLSQKVNSKYVQDAAFYQIEEYIAAGYYATASDYALNNGFMLEVKSDTEDGTNANIFEVTVYQGARVRLYIKQRNGMTVKYIYGEDKG